MFNLSIKDRNELLNSELAYLVQKNILPPGFQFYWADNFQAPGDVPWSIQMMEDFKKGPHDGMFFYLVVKGTRLLCNSTFYRTINYNLY